jgi:single-strand DNA-binding protein
MLNTAIIMGRLTADPELKSTGSASVCSFTLAVDRRFKGKDEERQTDFIRCVAWRQAAEFLSKYFRKGSMVAVTGSIQVRSYEDKNGNKRQAVEVVADQINFTGGNNQKSGNRDDIPPPPPPASHADFEEIPDDGGLPF